MSIVIGNKEYTQDFILEAIRCYEKMYQVYIPNDDILYQILMRIPILNPLFSVSKTTLRILSSQVFWKNRLCADFPLYVQLNPEDYKREYGYILDSQRVATNLISVIKTLSCKMGKYGYPSFYMFNINFDAIITILPEINPTIDCIRFIINEYAGFVELITSMDGRFSKNRIISCTKLIDIIARILYYYPKTTINDASGNDYLYKDVLGSILIVEQTILSHWREIMKK
jgi:hypothetical protein